MHDIFPWVRSPRYHIAQLLISSLSKSAINDKDQYNMYYFDKKIVQVNTQVIREKSQKLRQW